MSNAPSKPVSFSRPKVGYISNRPRMDCDETFAAATSSNEPHLLTQGHLNEIVRDLNLSKKQAELLDSRLNGWNLLRQDIKVCFTVDVIKILGFLLQGKCCSVLQ